ncbi:MAG: hypothetical protein M3Q80_02865 [bacterium]|nr:hypothetical protein [bacterium]
MSTKTKKPTEQVEHDHLLFAVRHGKYIDEEKVLDETGKEQSEFLGRTILNMICKDQKSIVMTSNLPRAQETGTIIAKILNSPAVSEEILEIDSYYMSSVLYSPIKSFTDEYDVVIVVTHFESPSGIMDAFCSELFKGSFPRTVITNGNGFVLNLTNGLVKQIF